MTKAGVCGASRVARCFHRLVCLLLLCAFSSWAAAVTLKVSLPAFPPFAYPSDPDRKGAVNKVFDLLAAETGVQFDVLYVPYARMVQSLRDGALDAAILFKNESLRGKVTYVAKVSLSDVIVLPLKRFTLDWYEDLYQLKSIAVLRAASFEPRFDHDTRLPRIPVKDYAQGLRMMAAGRMDSIAGSRSGLRAASEKLNLKESMFGKSLLLNHKEWWLHFSNQSPHQDLIPILKKAVEKIYRDDLIWKLYLDEVEGDNPSRPHS